MTRRRPSRRSRPARAPARPRRPRAGLPPHGGRDRALPRLRGHPHAADRPPAPSRRRSSRHPRRRIARRPVVSPILRAGLGLLPGFLDCIDDAEVAHLGFYRDPVSLEPVPYYANMPRNLAERDVFVLDPMLATGNSGSAAIALLASRGATAITFVCLIAAPEGIATIGKAHPDVRIVTAVDRRAAQRPRLHHAGPRRRRRPDVRLRDLASGERARPRRRVAARCAGAGTGLRNAPCGCAGVCRIWSASTGTAFTTRRSTRLRSSISLRRSRTVAGFSPAALAMTLEACQSAESKRQQASIPAGLKGGPSRVAPSAHPGIRRHSRWATLSCVPGTPWKPW